MGIESATSSVNVIADAVHAETPEAMPETTDTAAGLATEATAATAAAAHAASTGAQVVLGKISDFLGAMVDGGKAGLSGVSHAEQAAAGRSTEPFDAADIKRLNREDPKALGKALDNAMKNNDALQKYDILSGKATAEGVVARLTLSPGEIATLTTCKGQLKDGKSIIDDKSDFSQMGPLLEILTANHVTKGDLAD